MLLSDLGEAGWGSLPLHNLDLFLRQPIQLIHQLVNLPFQRGRIHLRIRPLRRQYAPVNNSSTNFSRILELRRIHSFTLAPHCVRCSAGVRGFHSWAAFSHPPPRSLALRQIVIVLLRVHSGKTNQCNYFSPSSDKCYFLKWNVP